jgi:hypothetical protein
MFPGDRLYVGEETGILRYALFCDITQRRVAILYGRFGTTYPVPSSRVKNFKKKRKQTRRYAVYIGRGV